MDDNRTQRDFFTEMVDRYLPALLRMTNVKGGQYSGNEEPALVNFYEGGRLAKDTPQHYLMSMIAKQWYVLVKWSKNPNILDLYHKAVVQRLYDIILYLFLLLYMIEADGKVDLPGEKKDVEI